jgi:ribosomal protein S18 acetylase RimI-like enzyme
MSEVPSWSERLWGIDWSDHFPIRYESGAVCEKVSLERALPFIRDNYDRIFASAQRAFFGESMSEAKERFYKDSDIFLFSADDVDAGVVVAHPTDWSTYYLRTLAVLPRFQDRHLATAWVSAVAEMLRAHGVVRFEMETAPANHRVIHGLNKLGMMVTGSSHSERWGTLLRFTKILVPQAEADFVRRYCLGGWENYPAVTVDAVGSDGVLHLERRTP